MDYQRLRCRVLDALKLVPRVTVDSDMGFNGSPGRALRNLRDQIDVLVR